MKWLKRLLGGSDGTTQDQEKEQESRTLTTVQFLTFYNQGNELLKNQNLNEAIRFYDAACAAWSKEQFGSGPEAHRAMGALCWNNRAIALQRSGRRDEAIQSFQRALEIVPGHRDATHNLQLAQRHPERSGAREVEDFIRCLAANQSAKCRVNITEFHSIYEKCVEELRNKGRGPSEITNMIWTGLSSICPWCESSIDGRNLGNIDLVACLGVDRSIGQPRVIRFIQKGLCLNPQCSSPEITLCWVPARSKEYSNTQFRIGFRYPDSWDVVKENISAGGWDIPVQVGLYEHDTVTAAVTVNIRTHPKVSKYRDLMASGQLKMSQVYIVESIDDILRQMDEQNSRELPNYKRLIAQEILLAGAKAARTVYSYDSGGTRVVEQVVTAVHDLKEHQIICEAAETRWQEFEPEFDMVLRTYSIR